MWDVFIETEGLQLHYFTFNLRARCLLEFNYLNAPGIDLSLVFFRFSFFFIFKKFTT